MFHFKTIAVYIAYLSHLSPFSIFLTVVASGHILPIPESVTLILLGYISAVDRGNIAILLLMAFLATIFIDLVMYAVSLGGSRFAIYLEKKINVDWIERYRTVEERKLFLLVFASHFIPGWRFANPVIAGITRMPWNKFILYTFVSSVIYAPLFVFSGFFFYKSVLPIIAVVESARQFLLYALIVGLLVALGVFFEKHKKKI